MKKFHLEKMNFQFAPLLILAMISGCISSSMPPSESTLTKVYRASTSAATTTTGLEITSSPSSPATSFPTSTITFLPSDTAPAAPTLDLSAPAPTLVTPSDLVKELFAQVSIDRALNDLKKLSGEEPICVGSDCYTIKNRQTARPLVPSPGLSWAKTYVKNELTNLGYTVEVVKWTLEGYSDEDFIVTIPGSLHPEEKIYFVAHMDGVKPDDTELWPAADDNASGTVDLLELARILKYGSFDRTIVLLFSTGEEHGRLGVVSYLNQLSASEISAIKYVVDVDMIGYDANGDGWMQLWYGDHAPSLVLAQMMSDTILAYQLKLVPRIIAGCY